MKNKIPAASFLVFVVAVIAALPVFAQDKTILQLADAYSAALRGFQSQKLRLPMESLLRKGTVVVERYDQLESLSDAEYALLEKKMKGFVINREEVLFVKPDWKFFAQLSLTRGTKADEAFFAVMRQIRPDNVWTAYYQKQTDVTGCTRYGNGVLTSLYGKALQFKRAFPSAYKAEIDNEIDEILGEFTSDSVCACGDKAGVEREFRLFIKTFPKDKNTPVVKERLTNLVKNRANRFFCRSG